MTTGGAEPVRRRILSPVAVGAVAIGVSSLIGNVVWNCNTCGWDLDGVAWYEAILVAAVPLVLTPIGIIALGIRGIALRSRRALVECGVASLGLVLPWLYFMTYLFRRP